MVAARESNSEVALFRSYRNPKLAEILFEECTIWQACRATSAAPTFFDPIRIGRHGQSFFDGGVLYNNPVNIVEQEARDVWNTNEAFLISIGTGITPTKPFGGDLKKIVDAMRNIVTQTEQTANDFYRRHESTMVSNGHYFRFNIAQGMANIGLQEYKAVPAIADATQTYLANGEACVKFSACVRNLAGLMSPVENIEIPGNLPSEESTRPLLDS